MGPDLSTSSASSMNQSATQVAEQISFVELEAKLTFFNLALMAFPKQVDRDAYLEKINTLNLKQLQQGRNLTIFAFGHLKEKDSPFAQTHSRELLQTILEIAQRV